MVHQRRLADIRRTRDRDHQPLAQPLTLALPGKDVLDFTEQRCDLGNRRRDQLRRHIALVGEINSGFDQGAGFDDLPPPISRPIAEHTLQLAQRLAALPIGVGTNQIVETFGLGEIELAILERAAGELARLRRAHILDCRERREQRCDHGAPAMDVKLGDVFPGRARWLRKPQHDRIVDRLLTSVVQQRPRRPPWDGNFAREQCERAACLRPGYPYHGDRAWQSSRRQRKNGLVARMHGLFVLEPLKRQRNFKRANRPFGADAATQQK